MLTYNEVFERMLVSLVFSIKEVELKLLLNDLILKITYFSKGEMIDQKLIFYQQVIISILVVSSLPCLLLYVEISSQSSISTICGHNCINFINE